MIPVALYGVDAEMCERFFEDLPKLNLIEQLDNGAIGIYWDSELQMPVQLLKGEHPGKPYLSKECRAYAQTTLGRLQCLQMFSKLSGPSTFR